MRPANLRRCGAMPPLWALFDRRRRLAFKQAVVGYRRLCCLLCDRAVLALRLIFFLAACKADITSGCDPSPACKIETPAKIRPSKFGGIPMQFRTPHLCVLAIILAASVLAPRTSWAQRKLCIINADGTGLRTL